MVREIPSKLPTWPAPAGPGSKPAHLRSHHLPEEAELKERNAFSTFSIENIALKDFMLYRKLYMLKFSKIPIFPKLLLSLKQSLKNPKS